MIYNIYINKPYNTYDIVIIMTTRHNFAKIINKPNIKCSRTLVYLYAWQNSSICVNILAYSLSYM